MVEVLKGRGVATALVSAAGSSIYGLGAPPDEPRGWRVVIRSPRDAKQPAAVVFLRNESLSTSGSYEKFFWAGGRRYSHIMDPRTGYPARGTSTVSVLAPRTIDSEVWAKPYFINGRAWTTAHKPEDFACSSATIQERHALGSLRRRFYDAPRTTIAFKRIDAGWTDFSRAGGAGGGGLPRWRGAGLVTRGF
jgi:thiamine biosynthesis lipoprotein